MGALGRIASFVLGLGALYLVGYEVYQIIGIFLAHGLVKALEVVSLYVFGVIAIGLLIFGLGFLIYLGASLLKEALT